ncbi:MAG: hypothetical protein Q9165_007412 [Trypethelium subeluteriae]
MFNKVLKPFVDEVVNAVGNLNNVLLQGALAARLNLSITNAAADLNDIEIETEDGGEILQKATIPAIEESEAEDKLFWTAASDKTDLRRVFPESLLQTLADLFGYQLLVKHEQRGVAYVGEASTGKLLDLSSRLTNLEAWANRTPHKLHQIEHGGKKDTLVQLPQLKYLPEDVMHRTLVSNDSAWKKVLPTVRACRTVYYDREWQDYYVVETEAKPVSTDVFWGYFRPETLQIKEIGDASKAIPPSLLDPLPPRTGMTMIPEKDRKVFKWMNEVSAATSTVSDNVGSKSFKVEDLGPLHKRRGGAGPSIEYRPLQTTTNIPSQRDTSLTYHPRGRGQQVQNISARGAVNTSPQNHPSSTPARRAGRGSDNQHTYAPDFVTTSRQSSYASALSHGRGGERGGRSNRGGNSGRHGEGRGIPRGIGRGANRGFDPRGGRSNPAFSIHDTVKPPLVQLAEGIPLSCGIGIESANRNGSLTTDTYNHPSYAQSSIPREITSSPDRATRQTTSDATGQTLAAAPRVPPGFEVIALPVAQMKPSNPSPEFVAHDDEEIDLLDADLPSAMAHAAPLIPSAGIRAGGNAEIRSAYTTNEDLLSAIYVAANRTGQLQSDMPSFQLAQMASQGVSDTTFGTERIQPVSQDDLNDKRETMHQQKPPKKGQGKQRPWHQDSARSNFLQHQQLIDEYWGRPILPSEPLPPEPSEPQRSEISLSEPKIPSPESKDPSMEGLYHVALGIAEHARTFRGKLDLEVQLTQNLVYCRTHDTKRFADELQTKGDKEVFLNDAEANSGIISDATTRITTSARDILYLLGIRVDDKQHLFEKTPYETSLTYEFVCQVGDKDQFTIEVDQEGTQLLHEGSHAIGSIYWHFAEHIYDARVLINGTRVRALNKDDDAGVHELLSNLYIAADPAQGDILLPEIQTHVTAKDFRIKWAMIKRRFRFAPRPKQYENMALQITEVHDLNIMRNQEGGFRFYADHPSTMAHKGYSFYEASVVPKCQHPSFEENLKLEPGRQATWIPEDVLAYSRLAGLKELTTKLVARMDSVGKNNVGPWTWKPAGTDVETMGNLQGSLGLLGEAFW